MDQQMGQQQPIPPTVSTVLDFKQDGSTSVRMNDVHIAQAVARAVRTVPGVVALSSGAPAVATTYGAGSHVTGVVIRHPAPDRVALEIHVILSQAQCETAASILAQSTAQSPFEGAGVLPLLADRIRGALCGALRVMQPSGFVETDVLIDDVR